MICTLFQWALQDCQQDSHVCKSHIISVRRKFIKRTIAAMLLQLFRHPCLAQPDSPGFTGFSFSCRGGQERKKEREKERKKIPD